MKKAIESQGIVVMKADKTEPSPEIDQLLVEFGNSAKALPYYAILRPGQEPVHFKGVFYSPSSFMAQAGITPDAGAAKLTQVKGPDEPATAPSSNLVAQPSAN